MSAVKLTSYEPSNESRLERLRRVTLIAGDQPGLRALHDHKGELLVLWDGIQSSNMQCVNTAWHESCEHIVRHYFTEEDFDDWTNSPYIDEAGKWEQAQ